MKYIMWMSIKCNFVLFFIIVCSNIYISAISLLISDNFIIFFTPSRVDVIFMISFDVPLYSLTNKRIENHVVETWKHLDIGVSNKWIELKLERLKWAELEIGLGHDPSNFTLG